MRRVAPVATMRRTAGPDLTSKVGSGGDVISLGPRWGPRSQHDNRDHPSVTTLYSYETNTAPVTIHTSPSLKSQANTTSHQAASPPMATSSSGAPLPSPAPTLPTPHFPGDFPVTPSPSAYLQTEGPLEAAGRNLDTSGKSGSAGPVALLGAAAGLLVGGVGGALAGASLFGTAKIEDEVLKQKGIQGEGTGKSESGSATPKVSETKALAPEPAGVTGGAPGPAAVAPSSASGTGGGDFVALDFPVEDRAKVSKLRRSFAVLVFERFVS